MMRAFFLLLVAELFLGGGGRLTEIGNATLRMFLFSIALVLAVVLPLIRRRSSANFLVCWCLVGGFIIIHSIGVGHGAASLAATSDIFTDLRPLLYWLIAPFFAMALASRERILDTARLVEVSAGALAFAYLGTLAAVAVGAIDYFALYELLDSTEEFNFRGEQAFFYKGFLYLCIGLMFALARQSRWRIPFAALLSTAILLTLTRGFIIASLIASIALLIAVRDLKLSVAALLSLAAALLLYFVVSSDGEVVSLARDGSDSVRLNDMTLFAQRIDSTSLLFGHGFGTPLGERQNIENSYLWLVWKIGLLGALFWAMPLLLAIEAYRRIHHSSPSHRLASAFFFAIVLVYIQTAANPYLTNPIGLSFVLLALLALRELAAADVRRANARHRHSQVKATTGGLHANAG